MPRWKQRIDVREAFETENMLAIADILKAEGVPESLVGDVRSAAEIGDKDEFDRVWEEVYDWADDNRVWIATF